MLTEEQNKLKVLIRSNIQSARELRLCWEQWPGYNKPYQRKHMNELWHNMMERAHKMRIEAYGYMTLEELFG